MGKDLPRQNEVIKCPLKESDISHVVSSMLMEGHPITHADASDAVESAHERAHAVDKEIAQS